MSGWFDEEQHDDAVPHDQFDVMGWNSMRMESIDVGQMVAEWKRKYDYVDDFAQDAFNLLSKGDPRVRQSEEMTPTHIPLQAVTRDIAGMSELARLKTYTVGDAFNSALAMKALQPVLTEALRRAQDLKDKAEEAAQAQQEAREAAAEAGNDVHDQTLQDAAQEAQDRADGLHTSLVDAANASSAQARAAARKALNDASQEQEDLGEAAAGYGVGPGEMQRMSFAERATLAKRLQGSKLSEFAKLIGRFRQLASAEYRHRVTDGADEVVGVKLGDDLTRLTTQEVINMVVPELADDFWLRYVNRELLVKETRGREREGKGPIIVVCDESGTMADQPEMWAKGLSLALLDQAGREGRDFTYIGFGGVSDPLREFFFEKGKGDTDKVLDMAEGFLNGGTNFDKPLRRALDLVIAAGKNKPDIVFITDGDAPLPTFLKEWHLVLDRLAAKCFGIYISAGSRGAPATLSKITSDVRTISDLTNIHQTRDILSSAA